MTRRFMNKLSLFVILSISQSLLAQRNSQGLFEKGYQAYMRNQFPSAENYFNQAQSVAKTNEDKAFILKFLGISQFMRGDRKSSDSSFSQAVKLDPKIEIFNEEVLDPSVIPFFKMIKLKVLQEVASSAQSAKPSNQPGDQIAKPFERIKSKKKRSKRRKRKNKSKSGGFHFAHLLPLGIPQFYNGQYILGSLYGLGQVASLVIYSQRQAEISQEKDENQAVLSDDSVEQAAKDDFIARNNVYISSLEQDSQALIITFGLTYTTSIIHGIFSSPTPKRKKRSRKQSSTDEDFSEYIYSKDSSSYQNFHLALAPYKDGFAVYLSTNL